ncbi:MAG: hypothetical protein JXR83_01475 [Deltaproteobacteria bacterium]|nr:hypothetical protein [Deltaproteobacteria bacterium]
MVSLLLLVAACSDEPAADAGSPQLDAAARADAAPGDRAPEADTANGIDRSPAGDGAPIADGYSAGDGAPVADGFTPALCSQGNPPALAALTPEELNAALADKDFLLINVGSESGGQIPQTDTYLAHDDTAALVAYIGPDLETEVVLYCTIGHRSHIAGDDLVALGYCRIGYLVGGTEAWVDAGYTLE